MNAALKALRPGVYDSTAQSYTTNARSGTRNRDIEIAVLKFKSTTSSKDPIASRTDTGKLDSFRPENDCFATNSLGKCDSMVDV